jgi:hypothetical protein
VGRHDALAHKSLSVDHANDRDTEVFCQGEYKEVCGRDGFEFGNWEPTGKK